MAGVRPDTETSHGQVPRSLLCIFARFPHQAAQGQNAKAGDSERFRRRVSPGFAGTGSGLQG